MIARTSGIVIKNTKYSEASVISKIYTLDFGMQSYIINRINAPKAPIKASHLQPLSILDMIVYQNNTKDIQRIKEAKCDPVLQNIHTDLNKSAVAMFMAELIYRAIGEEEPNSTLFEFLKDSIIELDKDEKTIPLAPLLFIISLTRFLGFYPGNEYSEENCYFHLQEGYFSNINEQENIAVKPPYSLHLSQIIDYLSNKPGKPDMKIPKASRIYLLNRMIDYYRFHLPDFPKLNSVEVLSVVMS